MNIYLIGIVIILFTTIIQFRSSKSKFETTIAVIMSVFTYLLTILIQVDDISNWLIDKSNLDKTQLIILVSLAYATSTIFGFVYQTYKLNKMKSISEYANYVVQREIQKYLDKVRQKISLHEEIVGKRVFVSIYYPIGPLINKRLKRVCHSGDIPTVATEWNGVITNFKNTQTGRCYKEKEVKLVEFDKLDGKNNINGLHNKSLQQWSKSDLSYRITIPFLQKVNYLNIIEAEKVIFIISINCFKSDVNFSELNTKQKEEIYCIGNNIKEECIEFEKYYDYYSNMI